MFCEGWPHSSRRDLKKEQKEQKEQKGAMQSSFLETFHKPWRKPVRYFWKPKNGHFFLFPNVSILFPFVSIFQKCPKVKKSIFKVQKLYGHKNMDLFFGNETIMQWMHFCIFFFNLKKVKPKMDKKNVRFGKKIFQFEIFSLGLHKNSHSRCSVKVDPIVPAGI